MRSILIALLLIASFCLSAQSQLQGEFHQKVKHSSKCLQAQPNQEKSSELLEANSEKTTEKNLDLSNRKKGRTTNKKGKADNLKLRARPAVKQLNAEQNSEKKPSKPSTTNDEWRLGYGVTVGLENNVQEVFLGNSGAQWKIDNMEIYQAFSTTIAGESCNNPITLTGSPPITGTGTGISNFSNDYSSILSTPIGYQGPDMVYQYTSTFTGTLDITFNCNYDNLIAVFTNCTNPGTYQIASVDANWTAPYSETVTISVTSGTTYYIVNAAYEANATGNWSYVLEATSITLAGEDCSYPISLTGALPISGMGSAIENYYDDYSLVLPTPWGYDGGDVVYLFTPIVSQDITITFDCDFDNVIAIFSDCFSPSLSLIDTIDINFNPPYSESLTISVLSGSTYYIVNAAYDALYTGDWEYIIEPYVVCTENLIPIGTSEIEPNNGLNATPIQYDPRLIGTPLVPAKITGNYYTVNDTYRDMDWFNFTLTQEMIITGTVDIDCTDPIIFIVSDSMTVDLNGNTYPLFSLVANNNGPEVGETLTTPPLPAGDYWFIVAPNTFSGIPTPVNYNATLYGEGTGTETTLYLYYEDFQDGMPADITLYDLDGLTPAPDVSSFTQAWNIMENPDDATDSIVASNSWYSPPGPANDWLVTPAISIGNNAFLDWDIKAFHPTWPDGYQVKISTTGPGVSSFTTTVYSVAHAAPVWETKTLDLNALGFANTTIWIAFINNSPDLYLLLLDDIKVYVPNAYDVAIQDAYFSPLSDFSIIPLDQAEFIFGATASNIGAAALSNITFKVDVLGTSYSESTLVGALAPGAIDNAIISTAFTPTTSDVYDFYFNMIVAVDGVLSNNEDLISIEISDSVMARDNGISSGGIGFTGTTGHLGSVFEIVNTTTLSSVSAYFNAANNGESFSFTLFSNYNSSSNTVGLPLFTSPIFTKTTAMANNWNTFKVPSTTLTGGNYLLVINQLTTTNISLGYDGDTDGFLVNYSTAPNSLNQTSVYGNNLLRINFEVSGSAPSWTYTITAENHSILVPDTIPITLFGTPVEPGDYIGVFYDQGGVEACGGYTMYTGGVSFISAWGAQSGLDDGFQPGEAFAWKIWDATTGVEYHATTTYNTIDFPNGGNYVTNGISGLSSLIAQVSNTHTLNLASGWSIISTYIDPFEPNLDSIFSSIPGQVQIVKDENGLVYWPQYGINIIGDLTLGQGYQIKCNSTQTIDVVGTAINPLSCVMPLPLGWSIMAYLHQIPADVDSMITPIVSDVVIIKSGFGMIYWPLYQLNAIGNFLPGQGYQIKLINAHNFSYPPIPATPTKSTSEIKAVHFETNINTGNNMSICFPTSAYVNSLTPGDEIAAFDTQNRLIGSAVYEGKNLALTVWGQDELALAEEGMKEDEAISFRVWKKETGEEYDLSVNRWVEGDELYRKNGISVAGNISTEMHDRLFQNYPNPFANSTEISFDVIEDGYVQIDLYDILGNKLGVIYSDYTLAGEHSVLFSSTGLSSGTYFFRLTSKNSTKTRSLSISR